MVQLSTPLGLLDKDAWAISSLSFSTGSTASCEGTAVGDDITFTGVAAWTVTPVDDDGANDDDDAITISTSFDPGLLVFCIWLIRADCYRSCACTAVEFTGYIGFLQNSFWVKRMNATSSKPRHYVGTGY